MKNTERAGLAAGLISILSSIPAVYLFFLKLAHPDTLINTVIFWGYIAFTGQLVGLTTGIAAVFMSKKSAGFYLGIIGIALSIITIALVR
jgi:hypothetical protein